MTTTYHLPTSGGVIIPSGPDAGEGIEILFDQFCEETGNHPTDPEAIGRFAKAAGGIQARQVNYLLSWVEEVYA